MVHFINFVTYILYVDIRGHGQKNDLSFSHLNGKMQK